MASLFGAKNNGAKAQLAATSKVAHSTLSGYIILESKQCAILSSIYRGKIATRVWKVLDSIERFTLIPFTQKQGLSVFP
jgi:hypothetical protein